MQIWLTTDYCSGLTPLEHIFSQVWPWVVVVVADYGDKLLVFILQINKLSTPDSWWYEYTAEYVQSINLFRNYDLKILR